MLGMGIQGCLSPMSRILGMGIWGSLSPKSYNAGYGDLHFIFPYFLYKAISYFEFKFSAYKTATSDSFVTCSGVDIQGTYT